MALDDIAPVVLAGILYEHENLADLPQFSQGLYGLRGQRGNSENHETRRQAKGSNTFGLTPRYLGFQGRHEPAVNTRARRFSERLAYVVPNIPPELGLPKMVILQRRGGPTGVEQHIAA